MSDTIPIRKTTGMALNAVVLEMSKAFQEIAKAAQSDGEAPEGYILDVDNRVWKKPDIAPVVAQPGTPETSTSSG